MSQTGLPEIELDSPQGAHAAERLRSERVGWLTTVEPDGTPRTSPIWFLWHGDEISLYSLDTARARNVAERPRVSFNLDGNGQGGDIVVVEGTARIDEAALPANENAEYLAKYAPVMESYGWTPEWFAGRYSVPIRISATRFRYW